MVNNFLQACLWALIAACAIFGAIEISKQLTAELEKRADTNEFNGWCNLDMKSSHATIECNRVSRLD